MDQNQINKFTDDYDWRLGQLQNAVTQAAWQSDIEKSLFAASLAELTAKWAIAKNAPMDTLDNKWALLNSIIIPAFPTLESQAKARGYEIPYNQSPYGNPHSTDNMLLWAGGIAVLGFLAWGMAKK